MAFKVTPNLCKIYIFFNQIEGYYKVLFPKKGKYIMY